MVTFAYETLHEDYRVRSRADASPNALLMYSFLRLAAWASGNPSRVTGAIPKLPPSAKDPEFPKKALSRSVARF